MSNRSVQYDHLADPAFFNLENGSTRGIAGYGLLIVTSTALFMYSRIIYIIVRQKLYNTEVIYLHFISLGIADIGIIAQNVLASIIIISNSLIFPSKRLAAINGYFNAYCYHVQLGSQYLISLNRLFITLQFNALSDSRLIVLAPWCIAIIPMFGLYHFTENNGIFFDPALASWNDLDYEAVLNNTNSHLYANIVNYLIPLLGFLNYVVIVLLIRKTRSATQTGSGIGEGEKRVLLVAVLNLTSQIVIAFLWFIYVYITFIMTFMEVLNASLNGLLMLILIGKIRQRFRFWPCCKVTEVTTFVTTNVVSPTNVEMAVINPRN